MLVSVSVTTTQPYRLLLANGGRLDYGRPTASQSVALSVEVVLCPPTQCGSASRQNAPVSVEPGRSPIYSSQLRI